jgi:hypothetical protein
MAYYAHTVVGRLEAEWEPLARHLTEVADGAGRRGQRFGAEDLAELAGLVVAGCPSLEYRPKAGSA